LLQVTTPFPSDFETMADQPFIVNDISHDALRFAALSCAAPPASDAAPAAPRPAEMATAVSHRRVMLDLVIMRTPSMAATAWNTFVATRRGGSAVSSAD
jgi:hypothetical protein